MQTAIKVQVKYSAAGEPFRGDFNGPTPLGEVRSDAMRAFGLSDGQLPDGSQVGYVLFYGKDRQDDLSKTLAQLAPDKDNIELKLSQQVTQG